MSNVPPEIASQVASVQVVLERCLKGKLCGVYLYGSALHGGLKPTSDIDLMVVTQVSLADEIRHGLMQSLLAHSAPPGALNTSLRPLEVTVVVVDQLREWRYPPGRELQFGEWLREDIEASRFEPPMPDPDLAILVTQLRQHSLVLCGPPASQLFREVPKADLHRSLLDTLALWQSPADWLGDERNIVLALARIWYTATTGEITTKDRAAAWAARRLPDGHRALVLRAANAYLTGEDGRWVEVSEQLASFVGFCKNEVQQAFNRGD